MDRKPQKRAGRPRDVRASDAERDAGVARLRQALTEGRIDSDEFERRVERVLASHTRRQVESVLSDLPPPNPAAPALVPWSELFADRWQRVYFNVPMTAGAWLIVAATVGAALLILLLQLLA